MVNVRWGRRQEGSWIRLEKDCFQLSYHLFCFVSFLFLASRDESLLILSKQRDKSCSVDATGNSYVFAHAFQLSFKNEDCYENRETERTGDESNVVCGYTHQDTEVGQYRTHDQTILSLPNCFH